MNTDLELLREFLAYNPETGVFTWVKVRKFAHAIKVGATAGSPDGDGYLRIKFNGKAYAAHRLAWFFVHGELPNNCIDHINGVKNDNRICNLRDVSQTDNNRSITMPSHNKSGYVGVSWHKKAQKWAAVIRLNGKSKHLGLFTDPEEAHRTYLKAKAELHPTANLHRVAASVQHLPVIG